MIRSPDLAKREALIPLVLSPHTVDEKRKLARQILLIPSVVEDMLLFCPHVLMMILGVAVEKWPDELVEGDIVCGFAADASKIRLALSAQIKRILNERGV